MKPRINAIIRFIVTIHTFTLLVCARSMTSAHFPMDNQRALATDTGRAETRLNCQLRVTIPAGGSFDVKRSAELKAALDRWPGD